MMPQREPPQPKPNADGKSRLRGPFEHVWKDLGRRTNGPPKPIVFIDEEARAAAALNVHRAALERAAEAQQIARDEAALLAAANAAEPTPSSSAAPPPAADDGGQLPGRPRSAPAQRGNASGLESPLGPRPSSAAASARGAARAPSEAQAAVAASAALSPKSARAAAQQAVMSPAEAAAAAAAKREGLVARGASVRFIEAKPVKDAEKQLNPFKASAVVMEERVKKSLATNLGRVLDLFTMMDSNRDGLVSRKEFTRGLIALGVCPLSLRPACDAVFDSWDKDGSGALDFGEIDARLRRAPAAVDPHAVNAAQAVARRPPPRPPIVLGLTHRQIEERADAHRGQQQQQQQQQKLQRMLGQAPPRRPAPAAPSVASLVTGSLQPPPAHREAPRGPNGASNWPGDASDGSTAHRPAPAPAPASAAAHKNAWRHRKWVSGMKSAPPRKVWLASEVPQMQPRRAPPPPPGGGAPSSHAAKSPRLSPPTSPEPRPEPPSTPPVAATAAAGSRAARAAAMLSGRRLPVGSGMALQRNMEALAKNTFGHADTLQISSP